MDSHSLLHGIFPTQGSNLDILHYRQILSCLSHQGNWFVFTYFLWGGGNILPFPQSYMGILCILWGLIFYWFYALKGLPPRRRLIILCLYRVFLFCFCMMTHFICKLSHLLAWDNSKHFLSCVSNTFICILSFLHPICQRLFYLITFIFIILLFLFFAIVLLVSWAENLIHFYYFHCLLKFI